MPLAVNQNWLEVPCTLVGYDSNGNVAVLGTFDFRALGIVSAYLVSPTSIVGVSNKGSLVQLSIKSPSKQASFMIQVESQNSLGNWNSLVSTAVSSDGNSVLLTDFGGIRRYGKNCEFVNSVENDVWMEQGG